MSEPAWMTPSEVAIYSRRSYWTVHCALRSGELKGCQPKPRAKWLIHREQVDAWLNRRDVSVA